MGIFGNAEEMNEGFFTIKETQSVSRPGGKVLSCASCGLYKTAVNPRVKPVGNFKKGLMIIYPAPTEHEDRRGVFFDNRVTRLMKNVLFRLGIDIEEDCLSAYAVGCPIPDDKKPTPAEVGSCQQNILRLIENRVPRLVLLVGKAPLQAVLNHRWKGDFGEIEKWRGWTIPDEELGAWLCPVFDPGENFEKQTELIWKQDVKNAVAKLEEPRPRFKKPEIEIIDDLTLLSTIKNDMVSIDFETTGIKPHAPGHRIACVSVSDSPDHCFSFLLPPTKKEREPLIQLFKNAMISKCGHNIKYEENWSVVRLRCPIQGWLWDSMVAAHLLDNRPGITGLKFQTYVNFGVVDYASEITPYLQADHSDGNALNKIDRLLTSSEGRMKLLTYNGLDTIYEHRLALMQMDLIGYDTLPF